MYLSRKVSLVVFLIALTACTASNDPYVAYGNGDYERARELLEPLAANDDPVAQTYMGAIYQMGLGIKKDYQIAHDFYEQAARNGHAPAQFNLGLMYYLGIGVEKDLSQAYGWFFLAGKQDHYKAQERLELMGTQVTPNQIQQAKQWAREQLNRE